MHIIIRWCEYVTLHMPAKKVAGTWTYMSKHIPNLQSNPLILTGNHLSRIKIIKNYLPSPLPVYSRQQARCCLCSSAQECSLAVPNLFRTGGVFFQFTFQVNLFSLRTEYPLCRSPWGLGICNIKQNTQTIAPTFKSLLHCQLAFLTATRGEGLQTPKPLSSPQAAGKEP